MRILDLHLAKACFGRGGFNQLAGSVTQVQYHRIEIGCFVAPLLGRRDLVTVFHDSAAVALHSCGFRLGDDLFAIVVGEYHLQSHFCICSVIVLQFGFYFQCSILVGVVESRIDREISNTHLISAIEVNAAVEPRQAPEILIFKVGTVAPAIRLYCNCVIAFFQIGGDVKFGRHLSHLAVSHFFAVDPDIHGSGTAFEVKEYSSAIPGIGEGECALIAPHRIVFVWYVGWVCREDISEVGVDGRTISLQLPIAGNFYFSPVAGVVIILVEVNRSLSRSQYPVEFPRSIEREVPG